MVHLFPAEKENQSPCKIARTGYRKKEKKEFMANNILNFYFSRSSSEVASYYDDYSLLLLHFNPGPPFIIYYFLPLNCQVRRAKVTPLTTGNDAALKAPTFGYR